jgi:uncharacterized membrane protein
MRLEFTIDIHRPVSEVFELVGNLENDPKWQKAVTQVTRLSAGPVGAGSRYRHIVRLMGRPTPLDVEFIHHTPNRQYLLSCATGPFTFSTDVRFDRTARGTRLVTLVAGNPTGLAKLAAITLSNHRRHEIEADLHNLKHMMEAGLL